MYDPTPQLIISIDVDNSHLELEEREKQSLRVTIPKIG